MIVAGEAGFQFQQHETELTHNIIAQYAKARAAMDYARIRELLHPDARFVMPGNFKTAFFGGECRGRDNICDLLRHTDAQIEFFDVEVVDAIVDGVKAAVRWRTQQRNRGSGSPMTLEGCSVLTQKNGLIFEYFNYCDTATICALAES